MKVSAFLLLPFALLISCGKDSDSSNSASSQSNTTKVAVSPSTSAEVIRRLFDIQSMGELENHEIQQKYFSSLNKKIIEFKLGIGQELRDDCYTNSETRLSTHVKNNKTVQVLVELKKNKLTPSIVTCPILENGQIETKDFRILPDLHITYDKKDEHTLREIHNYTFDHIVFDGSYSYIMNDQITLNAKKVVFRNAMFTTYPFDQLRAANGQDGLDGGQITFNTIEVLGSVDFNLFGQDGGEIVNQPPQVVTPIPEDPALNGNCKKRCSGLPGRQGHKGRKGYNGRNGGNSGSFTLKFEKSLGLELYYQAAEGKGSQGGAGGLGGPGQLGGWHDKMDTTDHLGGCKPNCIRIPFEAMRTHGRAASGEQGEPGDRGDQGKSGKIISSKIIHKNETTLLNTKTNLSLQVDHE